MLEFKAAGVDFALRERPEHERVVRIGAVSEADQHVARTLSRIVVVAVREFLRNPFSFLFTRSSGEDRIAQYVIREHERGRPLADILDDPYIKNRTTQNERDRLLDRPEVVRALGQDVVESARRQAS